MYHFHFRLINPDSLLLGTTPKERIIHSDAFFLICKKGEALILRRL